jgi:intracellular sulfur oxidation DsrE/DsrF family protein
VALHIAERDRWPQAIETGRALIKLVGEGGALVLVADGEAAALCLECQHDLMTGMKQLIIEGAEIRICEASLRARGLDPAGVPDYLVRVGLGAGELVRLQEEGFGYLRP